MLSNEDTGTKKSTTDVFTEYMAKLELDDSVDISSDMDEMGKKPGYINLCAMADKHYNDRKADLETSPVTSCVSGSSQDSIDNKRFLRPKGPCTAICCRSRSAVSDPGLHVSPSFPIQCQVYHCHTTGVAPVLIPRTEPCARIQ
jgi:hypothetical protein